ncbi:hypothetical protein [Metabacillus fastidiosus]|uniref:hypothetical protein n=1 Tax=Metabacillus fastidiosus TaxID=1458 RepID=UPI003D2AD263
MNHFKNKLEEINQELNELNKSKKYYVQGSDGAKDLIKREVMLLKEKERLVRIHQTHLDTGKYFDELKKYMNLPSPYLRNFFSLLDKRLEVNQITNIEEFYLRYKYWTEDKERKELSINLVGLFYSPYLIALMEVIPKVIYEKVKVDKDIHDRPIYEQRVKEDYKCLFKD